SKKRWMKIMQTKTQTSKKPLEIKNPAIAFDIYGKGAVSVTPKGLIWKNGKAQSKNVTVKWDAFIKWMQSQLPGQAPKTKKVAPRAAAKTARPAPRTGGTRAAAARTGAPRTAPTRTGTAKLATARRRNGISAKKTTVKTAASARKVSRARAH